LVPNETAIETATRLRGGANVALMAALELSVTVGWLECRAEEVRKT
jgi:hypothetical protein